MNRQHILFTSVGVFCWVLMWVIGFCCILSLLGCNGQGHIGPDNNSIDFAASYVSRDPEAHIGVDSSCGCDDTAEMNIDNDSLTVLFSEYQQSSIDSRGAEVFSEITSWIQARMATMRSVNHLENGGIKKEGIIMVIILIVATGVFAVIPPHYY